MSFHVIELKKGSIHIRKADYSDLKELVYILVQLIPIGYGITYGDIAKALKISPRLVGKILMENTKPIIIPCHRVIGIRSIGGYTVMGKRADGLKKKLLSLESKGDLKRFNLTGYLGIK
ncbi:MAG: MGMT family protein [Ignisphaera sp.]|uniref:MGMT family protein n=1 Tax=Ignisphaera aggregans TaxID=334771 RepID=A0A7J3MWD8_9CREN